MSKLRKELYDSNGNKHEVEYRWALSSQCTSDGLMSINKHHTLRFANFQEGHLQRPSLADYAVYPADVVQFINPRLNDSDTRTLLGSSGLVEIATKFDCADSSHRNALATPVSKICLHMNVRVNEMVEDEVIFSHEVINPVGNIALTLTKKDDGYHFVWTDGYHSQEFSYLHPGDSILHIEIDPMVHHLPDLESRPLYRYRVNGITVHQDKAPIANQRTDLALSFDDNLRCTIGGVDDKVQVNYIYFDPPPICPSCPG